MQQARWWKPPASRIAAQGLAEIILTDADTQNLPIGTVYYDVQYKRQGDITSTQQAQLTLIADIRRTTG